MKVRRGEPRDAAAIASVLLSAFAEYELLYTPAAFTATTPSRVEIEQRIREGPVWIAVCDDVVVGTVSAMRRAEQLLHQQGHVLRVPPPVESGFHRTAAACAQPPSQVRVGPQAVDLVRQRVLAALPLPRLQAGARRISLGLRSSP